MTSRKLNIAITAKIIDKIASVDYFQQAKIIPSDYFMENHCWIAWISFLLITASKIIVSIARILFFFIDQSSLVVRSM